MCAVFQVGLALAERRTHTECIHAKLMQQGKIRLSIPLIKDSELYGSKVESGTVSLCGYMVFLGFQRT